MPVLILFVLFTGLASLIAIDHLITDAIRFIQSLPIIRSIPFAYTAHIIFFFCIYFVYRYLSGKYRNYKRKKNNGGYVIIDGKEFYKDAYGRIFESYETYQRYMAAVIDANHKRFLETREYYYHNEK